MNNNKEISIEDMFKKMFSKEELEEMEKKFNELKAQAEQSGSSTTNP